MAYRKFTADRIFTGHKMLDGHQVIITDQKGVIKEIVSIENAGEQVEHFKGILSPGFINCHCHLELSHLKGVIPEAKGMIAFLLTVMNNRNLESQFIYEAIERAEAEMMVNGIVAVGDICNTAHSIQQKKKGRLCYRNFIEATGFIPATAGVRYKQSLELAEQFKIPDQPVSIVPHAPYSVSPGLFRLINDEQPATVLSMHNQESNDETKFFIDGSGGMPGLFESLKIDIRQFIPTGKSSIQSILPFFSADHSLILVHNVVTDINDMEWINRNRSSIPRLSWCLCPNANQYITGCLPDVSMLKEFGEKIVVGTDSLASNHRLDILSELKTLQRYFPALQTEELLTWATSNGANALGIEALYGDFNTGKKPGIVLIEGVNGDGSLLNATSRLLL